MNVRPRILTALTLEFVNDLKIVDHSVENEFASMDNRRRESAVTVVASRQTDAFGCLLPRLDVWMRNLLQSKEPRFHRIDFALRYHHGVVGRRCAELVANLGV